MAYTSEYPIIDVTVDGVVFFWDGDDREEPVVLLIRRGQEPHKGMLALPGGFMEATEDAREAVAREVHEETGLRSDPGDWIPLPAMTAPDRDPRKRVITLPFLTVVPTRAVLGLKAGDDALSISVRPYGEIDKAGPMGMAFDHWLILREAYAEFLLSNEWAG